MQKHKYIQQISTQKKKTGLPFKIHIFVELVRSKRRHDL